MTNITTGLFPIHGNNPNTGNNGRMKPERYTHQYGPLKRNKTDSISYIAPLYQATKNSIASG